nr:MAG TPA: tail protein [Caudoviricetes sp.]
MIPVLYKANATDFTTFGIGVLKDCTFCEVTEERNGAYECQFKYPITGAMYKELATERIVKAKPNDTAADQAFRIYRISTPINGEVTVYAQHISYDLSNVAALQWSDSNISAPLAMERVFQNTATPHNFTCQTDYSSAKAFSVSKPQSVRACLGGVAGSFLDLWGGEYEWDNFKVIHHQGRGQHTGVVIEYGKNLTEMEHDNENTDVYTDLLPYAIVTAEEGTETAITLPEVLLPISDTTLVQRKTLIRDFTSYFDEENPPTEDGLRAFANNYLKNNPLGTSVPTLTVAFEPLWKQPDYAAVLERVSLCDTVTIRHSVLGITAKAKVITTVYDTLAEKYVSITLGSAKANLLNNVSSAEMAAEEAVAKVDRFPVLMNSAIKNATSLITGQTGGYVVIHTATDTGKPYELLILDAPSIEEAVHVWRWNVGGLGFSRNGYNGPYETAITADGQIVADFITSGTLVANIIKAGVLQSQDGSSYWDLETGEIHLSAYATTEEVQAQNDRISGIEQTVSSQSSRFGEVQSSIDGLNSYVGTLTETVETLGDDLGNEQTKVLEMQSKVSELEHSVDGLSLTMQEQFAGGINYVKNSAGLNGITDDWTTSGTVSTDSSTDVQSNTASDSAFVLGDSSTLQQVITGVVPGTYAVSIRAKKTGASYSSYFRVQYNGNKYVYLFNRTTVFDWTEFTAVIPDVQDGTITIYAYNRLSSLYLSDIILAEGTTVHKWTPAPNEIYTTEVKIDRRGIEVSNADSAQRTVINNTEFSGYYNEEKIFTLNKDETITKKTTVDGELTVGKTKFVPMPTASEGLNIVILD